MLGRERAETSAEPEPELALVAGAQSSVTLALTPAFLTGTVQLLLGCCLLPSARVFIPATRSEQGKTRQTDTDIQRSLVTRVITIPLALVNTVTPTRGQGTRMSARQVCHRDKGTRQCSLL